jgi:site-specific DNA-cytosine methylase
VDITQPDIKRIPEVRCLEWFFGYGGNSRGLGRVIPNLRLIAACEIEAYAVANMVAKMEAGHMDAVPTWSDCKTFPIEEFHGLVDIFIASYPCQGFSAAGKREGEKDPRFLWPWVLRAVAVIQPRRIWFENVAGHVSLGLNTVLSDLEEIGYQCEWGIFSAAEVGASHGRKRVFILGQLANSTQPRSGELSKSNQRNTDSNADWPSGFHVANSEHNGSHGTAAVGSVGGSILGPKKRKNASGQLAGTGISGICGASQGDGHVANSECERIKARRNGESGTESGRTLACDANQLLAESISERERGIETGISGTDRRETGEQNHGATDSKQSGNGSEIVADAECLGSGTSRPHGESSGKSATPCGCCTKDVANANEQLHHRSEQPAGRRGKYSNHGGHVADTGGAGLQGRESDWSAGQNERSIGRSGGTQIPEYPPGPNDLAGWRRVLAIAPFLEPAVCRVAHAWAQRHRVDRLRLGGNGVVPATAERAYRILDEKLTAKSL